MSEAGWSIVFTATAVEQATEARAWWREHRHKAPHAFVDALVALTERLRRHPRRGAVWRHGSPILRRVLMRRVGFHAYYSVDTSTRTVVIRAIWHAARRRPRVSE